MIDIKHESISNLFSADNVNELFGSYSQDGKNDLLPEPKPNKSTYIMMESAGMLDFLAAYDGSLLVGFLVMITNEQPHYSKIASVIESIFVSKEHRSHGTGKHLIHLAAEIAKEKGAVNMMMSAPIGSNLQRSAGLLGYTKTNTVFTRKI